MNDDIVDDIDRPRSIVLLLASGFALWLTGARWENGKPVSGYVENGGWYWRVLDGYEHALHERDSKKPVRTWLAQTYVVVKAPLGRDYNEVIENARRAANKIG